MALTTGAHAYGVLILDREAGLSHRMHDADPADTCDLTTCNRPMGTRPTAD
jgi:hypothetical protein